VTTDITHNMQTAARGAQEITQNLGTLNTSAVDASAASEQVLTAARKSFRFNPRC
jgi:methyl-accepting chemotaxis protein